MGKVNRNEAGKELRYPVILNVAEKEIARKVVKAFKQLVCGFDILRVHGKSYVCDVNGWSFVKSNRKYYDDCAQLLSEFVIAAIEPKRQIWGFSAIGPLKINALQNERSFSKRRVPSSYSLDSTKAKKLESAHARNNHNELRGRDTSGASSGRSSRSVSPDAKIEGLKNEELRSVIAIIRHGDRTPKQKMKLTSSYHAYLDFYHKI